MKRFRTFALLVAAGCLGVVIIGVMETLSYVRATQRAAILRDITEGKTNGGSLKSKLGQFVCFERRDALQYGNDARSDGVEDALMREGRCTFSDREAKFDMTAEGQERFATPHGALALWAGN